jgi:hypothetical protein
MQQAYYDIMFSDDWMTLKAYDVHNRMPMIIMFAQPKSNFVIEKMW